ncbi:RHS repeat-associated core domain-containing protein [Methylomonas koyamae]|uniref:RHS repeat-associated core domain-containing protein n=2 Tax=Methylomonas koyamae TaxID=702114 RepID=UPI001C3266CE|nr:RHS repeat-associated core domain-containing protein [Methylomonas koyamae]BBL59831.1 hypothetical protein MKFW12EY_34440 [Methylomonas koyamae]
MVRDAYPTSYDPNTGHWLSRDPIAEDGGINLYTYVENNPTNVTDPTGEFGVIGALVGAGLDLAFQTMIEGKSFECVNWMQVGVSGALGALGGAGLGGTFKLTSGSMKWANVSRRYRRLHDVKASQDVHHWAIERGSALGKLLPDSIVNHPANLNPITGW